MTGPATYTQAAAMPFADVLNRYQALSSRDSMARAITTLQARGQWNDDRSLNPDDYPPLTVAEHLELIALGEVMARHYRHPAQVHHAVLAGATWERIAAAGGGDPARARRAYREWAEGQHQLRRDFPGGSIGLGDHEYAAAIKAAATGSTCATGTEGLAVARCVISIVLDADEGAVPGCVVHAAYAPCMHDGEPASPVPLHAFGHQDREAAVRMWRIRTRGQRPLIIHDEKRVPDPAGHVIEDQILPCPCGAEVLAGDLR